MFCSKCGAVIAEGSKFCLACGTPVNQQEVNNNGYIRADSFSDEPTVMANNRPFNPMREEYPPQNYNQNEYNPQNYTPDVQYADIPVGNRPAPEAEPEKGKKAKKKGSMKKGKKIAISVVSVVLALALVLGSVVGIGYAANPEFRIAYALKKTLLDSKGFDFTLTVSDEWGSYKDKIVVDGIVDFGETTETTDIYLMATNTSEREDYEEEHYNELTDSYEIQHYDRKTFFETYYAAIYQGEGIVGLVEGEDNIAFDGIFFNGTTENLLNELESICENSESIKDGFDEYANLTVGEAFEMARTLISDEKINEDVIKSLFDGSLNHFMDKEFDAEMLSYSDTMKLLAEFFISGLTEEAFEIEDTYTENGIKKYDVVIDFNELMACLSDFIDEHDELKDLLDDIDPDIIEAIEELDGEFEEDFECTIGTKSGYFCYFESDFHGDFDAVLELTNINKPTSVATYYSDIDAIAKDWNENYFYVETYEDVESAFDTYERNN